MPVTRTNAKSANPRWQAIARTRYDERRGKGIAIERFFVITGGPGSGKSTLLDALGARGIGRTFEAGRAIVRDQVAIGGRALPWEDRHAFAEMMLGFELRSYHLAEALSGPVVFDRGVPDIVGYRKLCGLPALDHVNRAAKLFRYNQRVLVAPPWPKIFAQDAERKQTMDEAVATFHAVSAAYKAHGYELVSLPLVSVDERVDFVLAHIDNAERAACT